MLFVHVFNVHCAAVEIKHPKKIKEENSLKDTTNVNKNGI